MSQPSQSKDTPNNQAHTPGPWRADAIHFRSVCGYLINGPAGANDYVARVPAGLRPQAETNANAHLIAAAPDLLEAARLFVKRHAQVPAVPVDPDWPANGDTDCVCGDCSRFKPAIAKAEGRQP